MTNEILSLVFGLIIGVAIFLALREVVCWYFKINEMVRAQKLAAETLLKMYKKSGGGVNWEIVNKIIK